MILNHTIEALLDRRSIRAFRSEQISEEELTDILYTAKFAPSTMGLQARHFTVIQNKQLISDIVSSAVRNGATFVQGHTPFYNAPTVIVLSAPQSAKYGRDDAAFASMNVMLAAHDWVRQRVLHPFRFDFRAGLWRFGSRYRFLPFRFNQHMGRQCSVYPCV